MNSTLTDDQMIGCTSMLSRTYGQFTVPKNDNGHLVGANTLDTASIGIDLGLLTTNFTVVQNL